MTRYMALGDHTRDNLESIMIDVGYFIQEMVTYRQQNVSR
jgi:hypothetical protein